MTTEKEFAKALSDHTKQDVAAFEGIHNHLDRLSFGTGGAGATSSTSTFFNGYLVSQT